MSQTDTPPTDRRSLRRELLARREAWTSDPGSAAAVQAASEALGRHLVEVLARFEPERLGVYWAIRNEFNPAAALRADARTANLALALPYCRRDPREMHYRAWNGGPLETVDEVRIPSPDGPALVPDIVLAPCVGYTRLGYRLGYGGGYFDRWLAAHPGALAVGIAWSWSEVDEAVLAPAAHDIPLACVVTERGVVAG